MWFTAQEVFVFFLTSYDYDYKLWNIKVTYLFYKYKWLRLLLYRTQLHSLECGDEVSASPPPGVPLPTQRIDKNMSCLKSALPSS